MDTIKHAMLFVIWGEPVWAWLLGGAIFGAQEAISRSKKIKALTYAQAIGNGAAWLRRTIVGKFPVVGQVLAIIAMMQTPQPVAVELPPVQK